MHHFEAHELADSWELRAGLLDADPADASISACLRECAAALRDIAAPAPTMPTVEELEAVASNHQGHPADFAADVLERWGGWQPGLLGYGGKLSKIPAPEGGPQTFEVWAEPILGDNPNWRESGDGELARQAFRAGQRAALAAQPQDDNLRAERDQLLEQLAAAQRGVVELRTDLQCAHARITAERSGAAQCAAEGEHVAGQKAFLQECSGFAYEFAHDCRVVPLVYALNALEAQPVQSPAEGDTGRAKLVADLMLMVGRYWDLAYVEGKEGREHDTTAGDAQRVLSAIYEAAKHLAGLTPPDVQPKGSDRIAAKHRSDEMQTVDEAWEFWRPIICNEDGSLNMEQLKLELCDAANFMGFAASVYDYATGGMCTKVNTLPSVVKSLIDDHITEVCQEDQAPAVPPEIADAGEAAWAAAKHLSNQSEQDFVRGAQWAMQREASKTVAVKKPDARTRAKSQPPVQPTGEAP